MAGCKEFIIITEDTGAGKLLFEKISRGIYNNRIYVSSTAAEGSTSGGNTRFLDKTDELIDSGIIGEGSVVFLAFDNIAAAPETAVFKKMTKKETIVLKRKCARLKYMIRQCEAHIEENRAICIRSTYLCIEEVILSYTKLWNIVAPVKINYNYSEYEIRLMTLYRKIVQNDSDLLFSQEYVNNNKFLNYFRDIMKDEEKTEEHIFSDMLYAVTMRNRKARFEVTKSDIGICLYANCKAIEQKYKVDCNSCTIGSQ